VFGGATDCNLGVGSGDRSGAVVSGKLCDRNT
jgi:hypothetical protein